MGMSITDLSAVTTVGLDLAKHVFQVHGVDASGRVVVAKARRQAICASSGFFGDGCYLVGRVRHVLLAII